MANKIQLDASNTRAGIKRRDILLSSGSVIAASALSEALVAAISKSG